MFGDGNHPRLFLGSLANKLPLRQYVLAKVIEPKSMPSWILIVFGNQV